MQTDLTLKLSLKKLPFEVMATSEKTREFRRRSKWLESRLFNKDGSLKRFKYVEFRNGYGAARPYFITEFRGLIQLNPPLNPKTYSNGLVVSLDTGDYIIYTGPIIGWYNMEKPEQYEHDDNEWQLPNHLSNFSLKGKKTGF